MERTYNDLLLVKPIITMVELSKLTGISYSSLYGWYNKGKLEVDAGEGHNFQVNTLEALRQLGEEERHPNESGISYESRLASASELLRKRQRIITAYESAQEPDSEQKDRSLYEFGGHDAIKTTDVHLYNVPIDIAQTLRDLTERSELAESKFMALVLRLGIKAIIEREKQPTYITSKHSVFLRLFSYYSPNSVF